MKQTDDYLYDVYYKDISKYCILTYVEEQKIAKKIREGDVKAEKKLITANLRFVIQVARNYQSCGPPITDLINAGNIGLIKAAKRFDLKKNCKFISYAVWWIRQAILHSIAEQSRIARLPLNRSNRIFKIRSAIERLEQRNRRQPTTKEISEETSIPQIEICELINIDTQRKFLVDEVEDSEQADHKSQYISFKKSVQNAISTLKKREQTVIKLYYGFDTSEPPLKLEAIGQKLKISKERVRQIKASAKRKLKRSNKLYKLITEL